MFWNLKHPLDALKIFLSLFFNYSKRLGSRCQSNRRLCVIRQHTNDLMPTSRRSSTASLLQKQQQQKQQSVQRRSSYFERLALEVQKQALRNVESPMPTNKGRKNVGTTPELGPPPTKKTKAGTVILRGVFCFVKIDFRRSLRKVFYAATKSE